MFFSRKEMFFSRKEMFLSRKERFFSRKKLAFSCYELLLPLHELLTLFRPKSIVEHTITYSFYLKKEYALNQGRATVQHSSRGEKIYCKENTYLYLARLPLLFLYLLLGEKNLFPPIPCSISAFVQAID